MITLLVQSKVVFKKDDPGLSRSPPDHRQFSAFPTVFFHFSQVSKMYRAMEARADMCWGVFLFNGHKAIYKRMRSHLENSMTLYEASRNTGREREILICLSTNFMCVSHFIL